MIPRSTATPLSETESESGVVNGRRIGVSVVRTRTDITVTRLATFARSARVSHTGASVPSVGVPSARFRVGAGVPNDGVLTTASMPTHDRRARLASVGVPGGTHQTLASRSFRATPTSRANRSRSATVTRFFSAPKSFT